MLNYERPYTVKPYERDVIADPARLARYEAQTYRRYTATGNSDSHTAGGGDEPGYPRNYYWAGHDDPGKATDQELSKAIRDHRVIVTNGPFVEFFINERPIGEELSVSGNRASVRIVVRATEWSAPERWRLIRNGEIIARGAIELQQNEWSTTLDVDVPQDSWFVVEVDGDRNMFPVIPPSEIPPFDIGAAVGGLAEPFGFGGGGLTPELTFKVTPFAFTNPIWVIADGDGVFTPPNPPVRRCGGDIFDPRALRTDPADLGGKLGERRLDTIQVPFKIHAEPSILARPLGSDRRDVRILFESWGHHNH
jgi:hypothetical protein